MRPKAVFAILGVLASAALVAALMGPELAKADRKGAAAAVRAGDAVVSGPNARIEGGPSVQGAKASVGDGEDGSTEEDEGTVDGEDGSTDERNSGGEAAEESAPSDGEVVLKMKGDEGVGFSGTCSVVGEEEEFEGQVPEEFTIALDGEELECEIRKEDGDGTLKVVLVSENNRIVQQTNDEGTMSISYSDNGGSSSSSVSGSSNVVIQSSSTSSSSVIRSNSSSTGD